MPPFFSTPRSTFYVLRFTFYVSLLAACVPVPLTPPLPMQRVLAEQTQIAVDIALSATAAAEQGLIATQVAFEHGTAQAMDLQLTQQSADQQGTAVAATLAADQAHGTAQAEIATGTAEVQETQAAFAATSTQGSIQATGTVQAALAATIATEEAARQRRIQMMNNVVAAAPWLIGLAATLVALVGGWRLIVARARQGNVIRDAHGDPWTLILDPDPVAPIHTVNPDKALGPVLTLNPGLQGGCKMPELAPGPVQFQLTENRQMIELARRFLELNRPLRDPELIAQWRAAMTGQPAPSTPHPVCPSPALPAPGGMHVIHPYYQINPYSLPVIPLFDNGSRLLAGGSGSGKTNLALYDISRMQVDDLTVYDPKYRPGKWPTHAQVLTEPDTLLKHLQTTNEAFRTRRDTQRHHYPPHLTILDEYTALILLSKQGSAGQTLKDALSLAWALVMYGREFNVMVWILTQTGNAGSLGLDGRGDFRESLTRIDFNWRPVTKEEEHIPRIAEVTTGDQTAKYLVPHFVPPPVPLLSPNSPQARPGLSGTIPDGVLTTLRAKTPDAAKFDDQELTTIYKLTQQGESGNRIRALLQRARADVFAVHAACREMAML